MCSQTVTFDYRKFKRFKKAYNQEKGEKFEFEGSKYLKGYAKYLIKYLEMKFKGVLK